MELISSKEEVYILDSSVSNAGGLSDGVYTRIVLVDESIIWLHKTGRRIDKETDINYKRIEQRYQDALKQMDYEEVKMYCKNK